MCIHVCYGPIITQPALKPADGFKTGQPALKRAGLIEP